MKTETIQETKNMVPAMQSNVIKLNRKGFFPLYVRWKNGQWEMLEYVDNYGSERWVKIKKTKEQIESQIIKYAGKRALAKVYRQ